MSNDMYDEKGMLKPEYAWTDAQKKAMKFNNDMERIDPRTDFGKGIVYIDDEGHEHDSMKAVEQANKLYWNRMKIDTSHKDFARQAELEKAYFDCITPKFGINDKNMAQQVLIAQREIVAAYIKERYGIYLNELLKQYGYDQQDNNKKGPRR